MSQFQVLATLLLTVAMGTAGAGELLDLYDAVPAPASDGNSALSYAEDGQIVRPQYLAFERSLARYRTATQALESGASGAAAPSEQEPAALLELRDRYQAYLQRNAGENDPVQALDKRKRWLQRAMGGLQLNISKSMQPCSDPCTDQAVQDHNAQLQARRERTLDDEYRTWNALFQDWKSGRLPLVWSADQALEALGELVAGTPTAQAAARYRERMADEVQWLYSISRTSALRAEPIHQGLTGEEPDSISGATPKMDRK